MSEIVNISIKPIPARRSFLVTGKITDQKTVVTSSKEQKAAEKLN